MLKNNLLWARVIDPMSGRIVRQRTFLGAMIVGTTGMLIGVAIGLIIAKVFHAI